MIKRIVKLTFALEHIEAFRQIFAESKLKIKGFTGCHHVELLQDLHSPNIFFTLSIWDSEEALNNYRHSELFKATWIKTKRLFSDKPAAWSVSVVDIAE